MNSWHCTHCIALQFCTEIRNDLLQQCTHCSEYEVDHLIVCTIVHDHNWNWLWVQAAAAMCVGVGSFSDPQDAQGLAHFLGKWMTLLATECLHLRVFFFLKSTEQLIIVAQCGIFLLCFIL